MHPPAQGQQPLAAADDPGIGPWGQIHLIFDHLHHRQARPQEIHGIQPMLPEQLRNIVRLAQHRLGQ